MTHQTDPPPSKADALDRLRELIELDGRKLGDIAKAAGIAPAHLYQVRAGIRENPGIGTVAAILAALGKSWGDLDGD